MDCDNCFVCVVGARFGDEHRWSAHPHNSCSSSDSGGFQPFDKRQSHVINKFI